MKHVATAIITMIHTWKPTTSLLHPFNICGSDADPSSLQPFADSPTSRSSETGLAYCQAYKYDDIRCTRCHATATWFRGYFTASFLVTRSSLVLFGQCRFLQNFKCTGLSRTYCADMWCVHATGRTAFMLACLRVCLLVCLPACLACLLSLLSLLT